MILLLFFLDHSVEKELFLEHS